MTLQSLYSKLKSMQGFSNKVAYRMFSEKEAPALPFIVYYVEQSDNFMADGHVYLAKNEVAIELYSDNKDVASEGKIESMLNNENIPWQKYEEYIESEHMYQVVYEITI